MVHHIWYTKNERVQPWLRSLIPRLPIPLEGGLLRDAPIAVRTINLSLGQNLKSSVPSKIMFPCMYHKFVVLIVVQDIISRSIPYKNCGTT